MDRSTFEQRALTHLDAVYRMAMQLCRRESEAADLVQETFLRALRAADRFEEQGGGMRAWLFRILHNVFFSELDRAKRRPVAIEGVGARDGDDDLPSVESGPLWDLASLDWERVDARLKAAIERLRPEFREVLLLWAVEGLKYREIAEITEVPIGTVMSRLHRARAGLVEDLKELAEERGLDVG
ncbi:MAG: sigma-70 family RNA polymerase sigma factor [Phycisphaerales bacterium]